MQICYGYAQRVGYFPLITNAVLFAPTTACHLLVTSETSALSDNQQMAWVWFWPPFDVCVSFWPVWQNPRMPDEHLDDAIGLLRDHAQVRDVWIVIVLPPTNCKRLKGCCHHAIAFLHGNMYLFVYTLGWLVCRMKLFGIIACNIFQLFDATLRSYCEALGRSWIGLEILSPKIAIEMEVH